MVDISRVVDVLTNLPLFFLAICIGLALLAGTLRSVKQNLIHRPAAQTRLFTAVFFDEIEGLLWLGSLLALVAAVPHPVTIVLVAMFVASMVTASRLRYREEQRSLNRWLQMATETETSLAPLLDGLANGFRSRLARQAKACTIRLIRGESIADAARRAKLPLDADTLAAMVIPKPNRESHEDSSGLVRMLDSDAQLQCDYESSRSTALISQQFTYVIATMLLAWLIGSAVRRMIVPLIEEMFSEFTVPWKLSQTGLDAIATAGDFFMASMVAWLLFSAVVRWLPLWMVACLPWFGRRAIDRWRCEVLGTLERGMRVRQSESQIFQWIARTTRIRWIRSRCRVALRFVESGNPLPLAMERGKLVTAREQTWLTCAENNGTLPDAFRNLKNDIQRRQVLRWKIRMAWVVPLATVLVGGFVLAHALFIFQSLAALLPVVP